MLVKGYSSNHHMFVACTLKLVDTSVINRKTDSNQLCITCCKKNVKKLVANETLCTLFTSNSLKRVKTIFTYTKL